MKAPAALRLLPVLAAAVALASAVAADARQSQTQTQTQSQSQSQSPAELQTQTQPTSSPPQSQPPAPSPPPPSLPSEDGLRRCVGADGVPIFTDRRCEDLQAVERAAPAQPADRADAPVRAPSCAHSQDDLLFGVRLALENHDPNQLAGFYHWTDMGNAQGYHLMDRLVALSERPLVDVQLISPELTSSAPADLLRVDQMRGEKEIGALVTYFHLRSDAGCWWFQY